jgi:predicted metal-dependent phosphoesterase TrpH
MSRRDAGMRADLHVHSRHSGRTSLPLLGRVAQECYAEPRAVYDEAIRRGMDLVTLTDHDSIEGALDIAALPGTFMGEEVTCALPGGRELHLGVFDFHERQHHEIQGRRHDAEALFAYLAEQRLPVVVNHLFSALTGRRVVADLHLALRNATHVETLNGALPASSNAWARRAALAPARAMVGGSDAHTLHGVARAWTIVPGAGTREDFLEGFREGRTIPEGRSGTYARLTRAIADLVASSFLATVSGPAEPGGARRALATAVALLALPALPLITACVFVDEILFARRYGMAFAKGRARPEVGAMSAAAAAGRAA